MVKVPEGQTWQIRWLPFARDKNYCSASNSCFLPDPYFPCPRPAMGVRASPANSSSHALNRESLWLLLFLVVISIASTLPVIPIYPGPKFSSVLSTVRSQGWDAVESSPVCSDMVKQEAVRRLKAAEEE